MGKNLVAWAIIVIFLLAVFNLFQDKTTQTKDTTLPYSEFLSQVKLNNINDVTIKENNILDYNLISKTLLEHLNFNQNNEYKIWSIFIFFQWYANQ